MKFKLFLLILICSISSYSQCFDCGFNIGGFIGDIARDVDKTDDGIILTNWESGTGVIRKYDFNCNLVWSVITSDLFNEPTRTQRLTIDSEGNIYFIHFPDFSPNEGISFSKLNPNGQLLWTKLIGENSIGTNVLFGNSYIYIIGRFLNSFTLDNQITLTSVGIDYYIAKFDLDGNLIDAKNFFEDSGDELIESVIDNNGNIFFTGSSTTNSKFYSHVTKLNSNLDIIWHKDVSNNISNPQILYPTNLYYNDENDKLYLWGSFLESVNIDGNILIDNTPNGFFASALCEINTQTGNVERLNKYENDSEFTIPGVGGSSDTAGNTTGYIAHKNNELFILTSFQGEFDIGNQTISTNFTGNFYDEDLVLFKVSLVDFNSEFIFKTTGENNFSNPDITYADAPGHILFYEEDLYITAAFSSSPISIQETVIPNNSGNMSSDILFYKYNTNIASSFGLIEVSDTCNNQTTQFNLNGDFDSVLWNFDDPTSGVNNTSTLNNPSHTFTNIGNFNVTALVTCGTETETLNIEVVVTDSPIINQISDVYACEDVNGSQLSSSFNTSSIENDLIGNQSGLTIKYFDSNGIELPSPLPNPMSNSVLGQETILARVAYNNNLTCFTEISFDLIVNPLPEINEVNNIYACDDDYDGITEFDISNLETIISDNQSGMIIEFFRENGQQLPNPLPDTIQNIVNNLETITARITNPNSNCYNESTFDLIVNPLPEANELLTIYGCDDNNDGISEYFDTSNVESQVLNGQTGMSVSYFDQLGNELPNPLPNPYTNSNAFNELITIRVTDNNSTCYAETTLQLQTVTQPNINQPENLYACDQGNGYAEFDTSIIEQELIGNQIGLTIKYFDSNNNSLPSPLPSLFQNTEPFSQTISIRVEDASNPICYSETSFDLIVNELLEINLEDEYYICHLEPSISLIINSGFNSYDWFYQDGTLISNTNSAVIANEGNYTLTVSQIENGVTCENSFEFTLVRSVLPKIQQVNFEELGNNYIEIIASGDGDFEYSIDGINYQDSNYFSNIQGGMHTVFVRDKDGCGQDSEEVTVIDYPKFFTPNDDGYNDFWQIKGIVNFPNSETLIFDRYGKLLARIKSNDLGWNGFYNGKQMMSNDYWFRTDLGNGQTFTGHFSLKR